MKMCNMWNDSTPSVSTVIKNKFRQHLIKGADEINFSICLDECNSIQDLDIHKLTKDFKDKEGVKLSLIKHPYSLSVSINKLSSNSN